MTASPRGTHYEPATLTARAITKYDGETGGAKDYPQELAAVQPEDCDVINVGGKLYVPAVRAQRADCRPGRRV